MIFNINNQSRWTLDEIESLKVDYISFVDKSIMVEKYNRQWKTIQSKANSIGLKSGYPKSNKCYKLPLTKDEIIELYNSNKSSNAIAKICGCSGENIIRILKNENIQRRVNTESHKKYTINDNIFDNIDTQEKAYILGLFYADGYNNEKGAAHITLQYKDKQILEDIRKYIGSNKPLRFIQIEKEQDMCSLNIENKYISNKLAELGCVQCKSLILKFPTEEQVPSHLHNHFIRGYFDGDGCISYSSKYNVYTFALEGNKYFTLKAQEILMKECFLNKTKIIKKLINRQSSVSLKYGGKFQIQKIMDYLYKDATIFLNRKYEKFKEITKS
jgi:intein-encoded DNA endonuclease-like protein